MMFFRQKKSLLLPLFLGLGTFFNVLNAQSVKSIDTDLSLFGSPGLLFTPSAYLTEWGEINLGMTHYAKETSYTFGSGISTERSFWTNIGFLPFGEINIKLTKPYGTRNRTDTNFGIGDRSISFRLQILKEKENRPAVLIGIQDPFQPPLFSIPII